MDDCNKFRFDLSICAVLHFKLQYVPAIPNRICLNRKKIRHLIEYPQFDKLLSQVKTRFILFRYSFRHFSMFTTATHTMPNARNAVCRSTNIDQVKFQ